MIIVLFSIPVLALGQRFAYDQNLPYYDDKWFRPGFFVAMNYATYRIEHHPEFFLPQRLDSVKAINPIGSPGITLGFIANLRLHDQVDLRFNPGVSFMQRGVEYDFANGDVISESVENTYLEFPLLLKVRSMRRDNWRVYLVGGAKYGVEVGSRRKERTEEQLRTTPNDLTLEFGFGFDIYFEMFKFAPEIRFSHGLVNLLNDDPNIYAQSLLHLKTQTVTLYLNFE